MLPEDLVAMAQDLLARARQAGVRLATAESCTGGLIAACLTEVPGASDVFERGFVTYANAAKVELLNVPQDMLASHGAVSAPVARAMAEGALARSQAHLAVAVTGIAGPGGGSVEKPVGLVHLALAGKEAPTRHVEKRFGDIGRDGVRHHTVAAALSLFGEGLAAWDGKARP